MWKMHGKLSGTGRLHGLVIDQAVYSGRNFWQSSICNGQYIATYTQVLIWSVSFYVSLYQFNRYKGALFLPEAGHAFLLVASDHSLLFFTYQFHNNQKPYLGNMIMSCLGTIESHLMYITFPLSCYKKLKFKSISWK